MTFKYKAVFLDWDDTIGDWTSAEHKALSDVYDTYHLNDIYPTLNDYLAAYHPYNLSLWAKYGRGEITKDLLHFERFYHPLTADGRDSLLGKDKAKLAHEIGNTFLQLTNKYFSLLPDSAQTVHYLESKYPLTIISNGFSEVQHYKFAHSGLQNCFKHILISDEIGINKPQPEIFRIALERNGVQANEAIMIGDSYTSDIAGAKAAGIDQIWVCKAPANAKNGESATFIVSDITEVTKIL